MSGVPDRPARESSQARQARADAIYFRLLAEEAQSALDRSGYRCTQREHPTESAEGRARQQLLLLQPPIVWFRAAVAPKD